MQLAAQIPFELFAPEAPSFNNFVVGNNAELLTLLAALSHPQRQSTAESAHHSAYVFWGGAAVGKTHLLTALASAAGEHGLTQLTLAAGGRWPTDPFCDVQLLTVDNADQLSAHEQAWLFTAFNHVAQRGGCTVATGRTPPGLWPMRDDIRTRLGSGIAVEVVPIPQDELLAALGSYAKSRGFIVSDEVLTYLLSHTQRDLSSLCHTLAGVDQLALAQKRAVTIPLVRVYFAQQSQ
jgi:DnaA-homolog protein